jgi:hypothetical protein
LLPPALLASGPRLRALASAVILLGVAISLPNDWRIHRETIELGEVSCLDGLDYEEAVLGGDVVYSAFHRPSEDDPRFAVGKHTFVRYARPRISPGCLFLLARETPAGWLTVARGVLTFSTRDPDALARWRSRQVPVPSAWLFPRVVAALPPAGGSP